MYGDDTYQASDIRDFVQTRRNLEQSNQLTDPLFDKGIGKIDLLFRFTDKQTPALGFRHVTDDLYALAYLDPGIATLWAREWESSPGSMQPQPASFIDIANLDAVNASVDAMRASLFGTGASEPATPVKHNAAALLYRVAHAGHEISAYEATQLYDLAKALEGFLGALTPLGRNLKR